MNLSLEKVLFSGYQRKVLSLLYQQPEVSLHVREIARLTGTQPGTLHKELRKLAEAGLLLKRAQGRQVSYQANRDCIVFEEIASILRKTGGAGAVIADALAPLREQLKVVFIFGSVAAGTANTHSDIDLLVIGQVDYAAVVTALYPAQELLGREINPVIYQPADWLKAASKSSAFVQELTQKPVIEIIGSKHDLG